MPPVALAPHVFKGYARILACMFHPHDARERHKFFDATLGDAFIRRMADGKPLPEMPEELRLKTIVAAGLFSETRRTARVPALKQLQVSGGNLTVHGGILCGLQYLLTFQLVELTGEPVPRALADKEIGGFLKKRPFLFKSCSRHAMKMNWLKYRGAAHLWAALHVCGRWPEDENELLEFISLAELFRIWGEGYRTRGC